MATDPARQLRKIFFASIPESAGNGLSRASAARPGSPPERSDEVAVPQDRAAFGDTLKGVGMTAGAITMTNRMRAGQRRRMDTDKTGLAGMVRGVLILLAIAAGTAGTVSHSAAQGAGSDVAYVEAITGRVLASAQGNPTFVDLLDVIADRTRLDLTASSQLSICHYRTGKLFTLRGPLRASVLTSGITGENGIAVDTSAGTCAAPVFSIFHGGVVYRGLEPMKAVNVSLQPSIKVVNRGLGSIRRVALWDGMRQNILTIFDRNMAHPTLDEGQSYVLVIERSDGSELKMTLEARAVAKTGPLIVIVW